MRRRVASRLVDQAGPRHRLPGHNTPRRPAALEGDGPPGRAALANPSAPDEVIFVQYLPHLPYVAHRRGDHHHARMIAPMAIFLAEVLVIMHLHIVALHLSLAVAAFGREVYESLRNR